MSLAPEARTEADAFADSVKLASLFKAAGLPVSGARHDGVSLAVGFVTPRDATAQISVPSLSATPDIAIRRRLAAIHGQPGGL